MEHVVGEPRATTEHFERLTLEDMPPLDPALEYVDAIELNRILVCRVVTLEAQVQKLSNLLAAFAKRQIEMRADLLAAGAFEKKSAIVMPGSMQ